MRIDFESLQLQNPVRTSTGAVNKAGNCVVDTLKFSTTSGDKLETLCGTETDMSQHIYMGNLKKFTFMHCITYDFVKDLGYDSSDSLTINFDTNVGTPTSTSSRSLIIN